MIYAGIFITELILLYFLSRHISLLFFRLFYKITRHQKITIYLTALFFLPGTIIHEISHWLAAILLLVHTGGISLIPVLEKEKIKLGSVAIAKTDPFRRLAIGIAPVLIGISLIITSIYFSVNNNFFNNNWTIPFLIYFVFQVGNSMFSSKKDTEGSLGIFLLIILIITSWYFIGIRYPSLDFATFLQQPVIESVLTKASLYILAPIIIDLSLLLAAKAMNKRLFTLRPL